MYYITVLILCVYYNTVIWGTTILFQKFDPNKNRHGAAMSGKLQLVPAGREKTTDPMPNGIRSVVR
jgi:hypothetical protein